MVDTVSGLFSAAEASWGDALRAPFAALAGGDQSALETVWLVASRRLYAAALWRTGNPEDAADVVQEVFVHLASGRADLEAVDAPHLWLLTVTHRAAIDATRRRARRRAEPLESAGFLVAKDGDPERDAGAAELSRAVGCLPDAQREAIELRHFGGHSFREIARITGVPMFTAASRCRLGLARLRQMLGGTR
ncbi:MAG: RNA polymerase sigma factor [Acidobacteriota bacterium]